MSSVIRRGPGISKSEINVIKVTNKKNTVSKNELKNAAAITTIIGFVLIILGISLLSFSKEGCAKGITVQYLWKINPLIIGTGTLGVSALLCCFGKIYGR